MKQTNIEYLRGLITAYAPGTSLTISRNLLAGVLQEIDDKGKALPLTGGNLRRLAERIAETTCAFFAASYRNALANQIACDLMDAPEIVALQNEIVALKDALLHRESVIESLARPSTGEYTASRPNEDYTRFTEMIRRDAMGRKDALVCITCDHERGTHHHSGRQPAYDSCPHGCAPDVPCPTCEPTANVAMWERYTQPL